MEDFIKFREEILKIRGPRKHRITKSYGVQDAYRYYYKQCTKDKVKAVTSSQYYKIIRGVNKMLGEQLASGESIIFPQNFGALHVVKRESIIKIVDNKIITNLPIAWDKTLELWYEDSESHKSKRLVRKEQKASVSILYSKAKATYKNKSFYKFEPIRTLKIKVKESYEAGSVLAFLKYKKI